jgi:non-homologous end joining protein Ku
MKKIGTLPIRLNIGIPITLNVGLYSIKSNSNSITLKPLTKCCLKPREAKYICSGCGTEVGNNYTKGYKIGKDKYLEISEQELQALEELSKGFDLIGFISYPELDLNSVNTAYPIDAEDNKELYSLLYYAMKDTQTIMFGRFVMRDSSNINNQQFAVIRVSDVNNGLVIQKVERTEIIRLQTSELSAVMKEQLKSLKDFVKNNTLKDFDIKNFNLTKIEQVEKLIEDKLAGKKIEIVEIREKAKEKKIDFSQLAKATIKI